ncbi:hypothetical protein BLSTO_06230, partial [Blastocystis sp. subtype 1]
MSIVKVTLTEERYLIIPGYELPLTPRRARQIKFGEPVITGFTRSFAQRIPNGDILNGDLPNGERREYLKPMLFSGGVGQLDDRHLHKGQPEKDMLVVKVGGPVYHIAIPLAIPPRYTTSLYHIGFGRRLPDAVISPEEDSSASVVTCPANSNKCESTLRFTKESRENVHACY